MNYGKIIFFLLVFHLITLAILPAQTFNAWVNAGEKAMQDGDYYAATQYFDKALEFENDDLKVRYKMAEASRLFNDYYPAAYWYNQVVLQDKKNEYPQALFWLAMMNKMRGEYDPAKNLFYRYAKEHASDSLSWYVKRALCEVTACESAYQMQKDSLPLSVVNLGNTINTVYSDFGGFVAPDSTLYFSSLRFPVMNKKNNKTETYVTKILKAKEGSGKSGRPLPLDTLFNADAFHNGNSALSSDGKIMVFTRCIPLNKSDLQCELFLSQNIKGQWKTPIRLNDSINKKGTTNTQPCIAMNGPDGYVLYFVSDRPGGIGKMDIYKSEFTTRLEFSNPVNLGTEINSEENEATPFFHNTSQALYFSSDRCNGMGGYDVFKSVWKDGKYSEPVNTGYPINSPANDLYFTLSEKDFSGMLSSNRPGSFYIKSKTCCYDLYRFREIATSAAVRDSIFPATASTEKIKPVLAPIQEARQLLPLELYFHNDEPEPRTLKTMTGKSYVELYNSYLFLKKDYEMQYAKGMEGVQRQKAIEEIGKLFDETITGNFKRLERFANLLLAELKDGKKLIVTVRGQASPLAASVYNVNLSKRRISSFLNYLEQYQNGAIKIFLNRGLLRIEEVGAGESLAAKEVSDDLNDKRRSVYSPEAARERKIEVVDIKIIE